MSHMKFRGSSRAARRTILSCEKRSSHPHHPLLNRTVRALMLFKGLKTDKNTIGSKKSPWATVTGCQITVSLIKRPARGKETSDGASPSFSRPPHGWEDLVRAHYRFSSQSDQCSQCIDR